MNSSLFESLRFRVHVRNLLYDYVKKHCTVDYLTFTEGLVSEFFEDLQLVTLTDPYSLALPVDPLDTLEKIYSEIPSYSPYDDALQISQESIAYLKEIFMIGAGKSKTERVVMSDSYGPPPRKERFYPALTRRSRRNTKKLGSRGAQQPWTLKKLYGEHKLGILEVEKVEDPTVDLEDTLKIKISIDPGEQPAVKSVLQSTLDTLRLEKPYKNRYLDPAFLCSEFPAEASYTAPKDVFMPFFPRNRDIGISAPATGVELADFKDLIKNVSAPFEPVDVVNLDEDISGQNIVLVDGWQAIRSSPPSTPSSKGGNDETDELDEIRFPSSPNTTPPPAQDFKMDQILIPRSRRIGGKCGITPHILRGKTLKTFLAPLLPQHRTERGEGHETQRIPSPTPSSLIGQPPSAIDMDHDIETEANDCLDFDVGLEIQKVCKGYELDPDFFLDDTIDDKAALLMEVPNLPQPNEFPKGFYVPNSLSDLLIPSAKGGQRHTGVDFPLYRFLKKVKGCQSLNLELSWVPFTTDTQLRTVLEILDVVDLFSQEAADYNQALGLIDSVVERSSSVEVSMRRMEIGPEDLIYKAPTEEFRMMLNRKERSRLDKLHGSTSGHEGDDSGSGNTELGIPDVDSLAELQTGLVDAGGHSDLSSVSADICRPIKKPRHYTQHDQLLPDGDSPVKFVECQNAGVGDGELVLSENGNMGWASYSTSLSQDDDLSHEQDLVQNQIFTGVSFSPPCAGPGATRRFEPPAFTQPDDLDSPMQGLQDAACRILDRQSSGDLADFSKPDLSSYLLGSFSFAQLRARKVSLPLLEPDPVENLVPSSRTIERIDLPRGPPPEVCDANTIYLTEAIMPQSIHKYMACLELIQKRALVRALSSRNCSIELVERRDLAGVDLILDTDTAVIFLNLFSLPARCDACVDKVAKGSWKYDRLLIVFEAYGELSAKHERLSSQPYAYTPPIVKALKKFKRDLSIAEGCGTMDSATVIQHGFADTVEEAGLLTRMYGDWCEANDRTHGSIWGSRDWLEADFLEHEEANLASLNGMNHFSSSIILCQVSLEEFIDLLPEERISGFGAYIPADRIAKCNDDLDTRSAALHWGQL